SGNSAKADRTWSDWSEPLTNAAGARISSPNARYIEWKVEMAGTGGATPILNNVTLAYLPQNSPPVVRSVNVSTQSSAVQRARGADDQRADSDRQHAARGHGRGGEVHGRQRARGV